MLKASARNSACTRGTTGKLLSYALSFHVLLLASILAERKDHSMIIQLILPRYSAGAVRFVLPVAATA